MSWYEIKHSEENGVELYDYQGMFIGDYPDIITAYEEALVFIAAGDQYVDHVRIIKED